MTKQTLTAATGRLSGRHGLRKVPWLGLLLLLALAPACQEDTAAPPGFVEEDEEDIVDVEEPDIPAATDAVTIDVKDTKDTTDIKKPDVPDTKDTVDVAKTDIEQTDIEEELPPVGCVSTADCIPSENPCELVECLPAEDDSGSFCIYKAKDDGLVCDDNNLCTVADACATGVCVGTAQACLETDDEPCTFATCLPDYGCVTDILPDFAPCTDGNLCTDGDFCLGGSCYAGETNKCGCQKDVDCVGFDDGDACNGTLACVDNYCQVKAGSIPWFSELKKQQCDPSGDTPCQVNRCEPKSGICKFAISAPGTACEDGTACTLNDVCADGKCVGIYAPYACEDDNPCTADNCTGNEGCSYTNLTNDCDDGNACTLGDKCKNGTCSGVQQGFCDCKVDADCADKDDANLCNGSFICQDNVCIIDIKTIKTCPGSKAGCAVPACEQTTGECVMKANKTGKPCNDGNKCTVGDLCNDKGTCEPGAAANCDDNNPCTDDACVKQLGCQHYTNLSPCDDGEVCTVGDKCDFGACQPGKSSCDCKSDNDCAQFAGADKCKGNWFCDAGSNKCVHDPASVVVCDTSADNACVQTKCAPNNGVCGLILTPDLSGCDDGAFCTVLDKCIGGQCVGDTNLCDDANPCTLDLCDNETSACTHLAEPLDTVGCEDGNACTNQDQCTGGKCAGSAVVCQDNNPCTGDACNALTGCFYAALFDGTACSDGNACTGDETTNDPKFLQDRCFKGQCVAGMDKVCKSQNSCVQLSCDPTATVALPGLAIGCGNPVDLLEVDCDDGNFCTEDEACAAGGLCTGGTALVCDDENPCTEDACNPSKGCVYLAAEIPCDDGDACTENDFCKTAQCLGVPKNCDDENICTNDSCDQTKNPVSGCVYSTGQNNCGSFAACAQVGDVPKCVFTGGAHMVISEVFVGIAGDPSDDWVEIHNPTPNTAQIGEYVLEVRATNAASNAPWKTIATGTSGISLPPGGYVLLARSTPVGAGVTADIIDPNLDLELAAAGPPPGVDAGCFVDPKRDVVLRLRDVPHQLEHDRIHWSLGALPMPAGVTAVNANAWPDYASIERKASAQSTRETLMVGNPEWLAGNGRDSDVDTADFVVRRRPEPQNRSSLQVEPACGGACSLGKVCNWAAGATACVVDPECKAYGGTAAAACGAGLECNGSLGQCGPTAAGSIKISEIGLGLPQDPQQNSQFFEIYNPSGGALSVGGWVLQWKGPGNLVADPWQDAVTFPLATTVAPRGYHVVASQAFARKWGSVDTLLPAPLPMSGDGGALRLLDPRTGATVDVVGWGNSATFTNQALAGQYKAASTALPGFSIVRKAKADSTEATMQSGGADWLGGNGLDTGNDSLDFVVVAAEPQSAASGVYEPACGGTCPSGESCNFAGINKDACVVATCEPCDIGLGCNPKTSQCDLGVVIAEVATEGPAATSIAGGVIQSAANEYILLYNPSATPIAFVGSAMDGKGGVLIGTDGKPIKDAMGFQRHNGTNWISKLTEYDPTKTTGMKGTVPPYGYYLIVPPVYDKTLPTPDHVSSFSWGLSTESGAIRLIRAQGKWGLTNIRDQLGWGLSKALAEGQEAAPSSLLATCPGSATQATIRRKASAASTAASLGSPANGDFWRGAGRDSGINANDWVRLPARLPRSSLCAPPLASGGPGFCESVPPQQRP